MAISLTWIDHASFRLAGTRVIYIDPWKVTGNPADGDLAIVSHAHYDHCSAEDIDKVLRPSGEILASVAAVAEIGRGYASEPGQKVTLADVELETYPAYNLSKKFHPREAGGLGVVITIDGCRIYYAGDTDVIDEMGDLRDIDLALLPIGGTYTMSATEAAEACRRIRPSRAIPYHYGAIVGSDLDAQTFAAAAPCKVSILRPGETLCIG